MHFPNDVTSDSDGNAYVSDSFAGVVYKVDADGNAEIFAQGDLLTAQGFGPNGIEVVNDEFLLLAVTANATLIKIPLDDPTNMSEVALPEALGGDGLLLHPNGDLLMVAPSPDGNELIALRSDDNWESATIVDRQPAPGATTAALRGDAVYAVNAHLGELFGDGASVAAFEINRIDLALDAAAASAGDAANGQSLFVTNCSVCHNADSEATLVGPGLLGISERAATRVEGLSAEAYIRQSILEPGAFVVEGFPPAMPATFGAMFTDEQIDDLVAYLKSL
ncbi:MAG: hypothetical protein D6737_16130 [Chloroflexi bacterium]|nr:MAG: hypothetical protein D6737_16130 [Chloroflexota bacterium]